MSGDEPKRQSASTSGAPAPDVPAPRASKPRVKVSVKTGRYITDMQGEEERKSLVSVRKSLVFLGFVAVAYALYLVFSGQMGAFFSSLANVSTGWVVAAMLAYVVYYLLGVSAYVMAVVDDPKSPVGIRDLMSVEAAGIFFSNLTPNGTGGAPAQIFRLTRAGLSMGEAGALQYTRFIIYEAAEGIFAALMLVFRMNYFVETYGDVFLVGALLFGFKVVEVGGLLIVCLFPRPVMRLGNWFLRFLKRRGWMKRYDHWNEVVNTQLMDFSNGFRAAASNVPGMLATLAITMVQLGCLYALPWFVLRAFGRPADIVTCVACGSMLELLTSAVPLPGGTGGAEGGFAFLFAPMFGDAISAGYVVWRMVEYFLPVLAATPLLGLRSRGRENVHERFMRYRAAALRLWDRLRGVHPRGPAAAGARDASGVGGVTVRPKALGTKAAGAKAKGKGKGKGAGAKVKEKDGARVKDKDKGQK
ncbi:MAG: flippase-like domain-containing protein [Olsenella sp.]|nr:flippase-like domain-containing protein [Olsenella sp.]